MKIFDITNKITQEQKNKLNFMLLKWTGFDNLISHLDFTDNIQMCMNKLAPKVGYVETYLSKQDDITKVVINYKGKSFVSQGHYLDGLAIHFCLAMQKAIDGETHK